MNPLASELARALDPARLMQEAGLTPDPWQADLLRGSWKRALLLCHRQAGKSTVTAALALHEALYAAPGPVLLLSPSLRQSQELFRKVKEMRGALSAAAPLSRETALTMELATGSRIISLPGKEETIRGYSGVRLLVVDEASRVPDALYFAVRPMLAVSGGRMVCLSTPFGKRGFFFQEWQSGEGWHRERVTADKCPRITQEFLAEERKAMGERWYRQEYECSFEETVDAVFSYDDIMAAMADDVPPLFGPESRAVTGLVSGIGQLFPEE